MQTTTQDNGTQDNAMTEIALALAMAFFSVMVLAMVSMGVPSSESETQKTFAAVTVAETVPMGTGAIRPGPEDTLIVFDGHQFLDRALKPLDVRQLKESGRVILAIDPAVDLATAIRARGAISARDVVVATLDQRWRAALAERSAATVRANGK